MLQDIKYRIKLLKTGDNRNSFEVYSFIKKANNKCIEPICGELFSEDWKLNWRCIHVLFLIIISGVMYSSNAYENRHNRTEMLFSVCMGLFDILGLQMLHMFVVRHDEVLGIMMRIEKYIKCWEKSPEAHPILLRYLRLLEKGLLTVIFFVVLATVTMSIAPIFIYCIFGRMKMFFNCFIPLVDHKKHPWFEIHVIMQDWFLIAFALAVVPMIGVVVLFLSMAGMEVDILRQRLAMLSTNIMKKGLTKELERELKGIINDHQQIIEYMEHVEIVLSSILLLDHFVIGAQICMSLFICIQQFWLLGYIIIFLGTGFFFVSSLFGTIIEWKFEKLWMSVWDVPWYLMDLKNQKDYLYFLGNTQKTDWLTVGGFAPIGLDTFVRFYKGIYTYLMVLRETQT